MRQRRVMIASFVRAKRRVWCSWAIRSSFGQGQAGRTGLFLSQPTTQYTSRRRWTRVSNFVGKPMHAGNLYRRAFQPLLKRAGLADEAFTLHSLRHTFATTLAEKGVHPSTA